MGRGGGTCNSKHDDAVDEHANTTGKPIKSTQVADSCNSNKNTPIHTHTDAQTAGNNVAVITDSSAGTTEQLTVQPPASPPQSTTMLSPSQVHLNHGTHTTSTPIHVSKPSAPSLSGYLSKVPLLSKLDAGERDRLAAALVEKDYDLGAIIVAEGEEGNEFYLIKEGQVRVTKGNSELCILRPNDYFGEQALVNNNKRMATVTAISPVVLLSLSRDKFTSLFGSDRLAVNFVKRTAVSAESYHPDDDKNSLTASGGRSRGSSKEDTRSPMTPRNAQRTKTDKQRSMLMTAVKSSVLFQRMSDEQRLQVVDTMWIQQVPAATTIIKQGDLGDHFYVVESGVFDIYVNPKPSAQSSQTPSTDQSAAPSTESSQLFSTSVDTPVVVATPLSPQPTRVATRGYAESFGELALLYNAPRAATVIARQDSEVWVLSRYTFRKILTRGNEARLKEYENFLKGVTSFEALLDYERAKIAEALEEVSFPPNHIIVKQGEAGDTFFIIKSGEVKCTISDGHTVTEVARYTSGNYFGERALVNNEKRAATVTAVGDVVCLYLNREAFSLLLGPMEDIFKRRVQGYQTPRPPAQTLNAATAQSKSAPTLPGIQASAIHTDAQHAKPPGEISHSQSQSQSQSLSQVGTRTSSSGSISSTIAPPPPAQPKFALNEFKIIGTLGKGSFGHVQLVKHYLTNTTYALKTVGKASVVRLGQQEHMINERKAMLALNHHPFLVKLFATFQDKNCIYLVLEPSLGGELFSVLRNRTLFDEPTARFFAAGVISAFEYMHVKGYIYRDLKPENLLLDSRGYLKITDFGFAKLVADGRTWTLCGTPDYLAPEVVSGQGHGKGVDWWTLGILIYEMLASYPPFYDEDPMRTYAKIMRGDLHFPSHFSRAAVDLIRRLLHPKATKRLGVVAGGARAVMEHPWFNGFDWESFNKQEMKAPIIMKVKSVEDLSNFEKYPDDGNRMESYVADLKHPDWDKDF